MAVMSGWDVAGKERRMVVIECGGDITGVLG